MSSSLIDRLRVALQRPRDWSALRQKIVEAARSDAKQLVDAWLGVDESIAPAAFDLLGEIDELSITPLMQAEPSSVIAVTGALRAAVTAELSLRSRLHKRLLTALADTRIVPENNALVPREDRYVDRRVCDDAFRLLGVLQLGTSEHPQLLARQDHYMRLPTDKRDALIDRARQSGNFVRCLEVEDWAQPLDDEG